MEVMPDESKPTGTYEFFLGIADRFGVPCLILAALLWMARDAGIALHTTVLQPVVQSHTRFLESTQETLKEIGKAQDKQADTMQELANGQRDIQHAVSRIPQSGTQN
jgi:hypothetical protein